MNGVRISRTLTRRAKEVEDEPFHIHITNMIFTPVSRYDYKTGAISEDVAEQTEQCMQNIASALAEAGCEVSDVVRVRYILPDRKDFPKCWYVFLSLYHG